MQPVLHTYCARLRRQRVAHINRVQWPSSLAINGSHRQDSVAHIAQNQWLFCSQYAACTFCELVCLNPISIYKNVILDLQYLQ